MPLSLSLMDILMRSGASLAVLTAIYAIMHWQVVYFNRRIKSEQPSAISTMTEADMNQSIHDMARLINIRDIFATIASGCLTLIKIIGIVALITIILMIGG